LPKNEHTRTVVARISGRVQGVCYRAWTQSTAHTLGLNGWVRNRFDGTVEALVSGPVPKVEEMLDLFRLGPPGAEVAAVSIEEASEEPLHRGFSVRFTE
jgi:acylphosphatase